MPAIIVLHELRKSEAKILRKLLLSLIYQQVVTGIGIQYVGLDNGPISHLHNLDALIALHVHVGFVPVL
jgi:hypothetical protein